MSLKSKSNSNKKLETNNEEEHELFYYANDRVRLMKEVLKLIKPKKIRAIAPEFMKNLDIEEINSMLLEELLGISNKRLKNILDGVNVDLESSTDSEQEAPKDVDVISLDDISDDEVDFVEIEPKPKKSKKHKDDIKKEKEDETNKLMSVLEILELQARARAIRSQLALENERKNKAKETEKSTKDESDGEVDAVIEVPRNEEVIYLSDSENEANGKGRDNLKENDNSNISEKRNNLKTNSIEINESAKESDVGESNVDDKMKKSNDERERLGNETETVSVSNIDQVEDSKRDGVDASKCNQVDSFDQVDSSRSDRVDDTDDVVINLDPVEIDELEK